MKVLDLFSGVGGFSLGLERAGMQTVAFCEIDPYCRAVLRKHWPGVSIFEDVRSLDGREHWPIDVVCGGFPCQPFSRASRGRRVADDLWPEMARLVTGIGPKYVIAENVAERPIRTAERRFQSEGYATWVKRIGADDIGADHARSRWWICAYADCHSKLYRALDAEVAMLPELCKGVWSGANYARTLRIPDGLPNRMERNHALGNAVIPFIPEAIGRAIMSLAAG